MGFPIEINWVHLLTRLRCLHLNPCWVRVVCLIFESARVSEDMCMSESHFNYVHTRCWGKKNLSRAPSHLPIAVWTGNAVQWGHTLGISALQLCCPVLLHSCERVCTLVGKAKVFYKRISYCCPLLCSRAPPTPHPGLNRRREIWQQGSFMGNNGNKEAQSLMVMRLYFRAVAASLRYGELFRTAGRQMCAWTVLPGWRRGLVTRVKSASDHLNQSDCVEFPHWPVILFVSV